ncbi:MAG: transporter [Saprospiraceae bacterium]|nr:transporter [Saprospiraceae bacterium]
MKKLILLILLTTGIIISGTLQPLEAQTPTDAEMMGKGQICIAALYMHDTWNEYWEGTLKRDNQNVGTLTRQTVMPMFSLGLIKGLNVIVALPWVKTEASGGQVAGADGIQDFGIWIKATALDKTIGAGRLTLHGVAGFSTPASNYLSDYAPFSLGFGCTEGSLRSILQYQIGTGPYLRAQAGYHLRGHSTIERDYYYTTQGYYTDKVNMPNAITYGAVLGTKLFNKNLKIEVAYDGLNSLGGHDIRRQEVGFPSNKMIFTRIGAGLQYFFPNIKGLGILANGNYILTGRNVGQSTALTGGITYQFGIWK